MPLEVGARVGSHEIVALLGTGGMGAVYRARDTKLHREVALKVLLPEVANDSERLARFRREAQMLASLNHPHIGTIHGLEESDDTIALVLELIPGPTLADRINEGPIPFDEALPIAAQIADALEGAHEQGIIHRDLKPANIKVRNDGTVKVLDFGLAKALEPAGAAVSPGRSVSPTITSPAMTRIGLILGTAAYMSPEQARGKVIDKRTDIWAFGCVLYEMLTGQRAFKGDDISEVIAAVLRDPPDLRALPDATPAAVRRLLRRCLERDPKLRLRDIGEARVALSDGRADDEGSPAAVSTAASAASPGRRGLAALPWLVAGLAVAALIAFAIAGVTPQPDPFPFRMQLADAATVPVGGAALSPDGRTLAFVGRDETTRQRMLFVRRLDQLESRPIPGTGGMLGQSPWWSPDGAWIGAVVNRTRLVKVALAGGAPIPLADVADEGGGTWSPNGDIVIGSGVTEGLQGLLRVNQTGGALQPLTQIDTVRKELSHQWPTLLDDGKTVLFTIWYGAPETAELGVTSLDDGKVVPLGVIGIRVLGVVTGQLVFVRGDGTVMAVGFDPRTRRTSGNAVQVQDGISLENRGMPAMNLSGGLVYAQGGESGARLHWADRSGSIRPAVTERRGFRSVRISPDGRRAAVTMEGGVLGGSGNIWIHDIQNGTLTPLTTSGGARNAAWSADSRRVLYVSTDGGRAAMWWQSADGSGAPVEASVPPHNAWNMDLAPDGVTTIYNAIYDGTFNLESFSLAEPHATHQLAASPRAAEAFARFSPDGRLVAYMSNESGRYEIYVRSFPGGGNRTQISLDGGQRPVWDRDGQRLYYSQGGSIVQATLAREATLRVLSREVIVKGPFANEFDVSPDGSRFLVIEPDETGSTLVVVPNWSSELRRVTTSRSRSE